MLYKTRYIVDGHHIPSDYAFPVMWGYYNVRAVSVRHAMNKALKIVCAMPGYADRANDSDWSVTATILDIEALEGAR